MADTKSSTGDNSPNISSTGSSGDTAVNIDKSSHQHYHFSPVEQKNGLTCHEKTALELLKANILILFPEPTSTSTISDYLMYQLGNIQVDTISFFQERDSFLDEDLIPFDVLKEHDWIDSILHYRLFKNGKIQHLIVAHPARKMLELSKLLDRTFIRMMDGNCGPEITRRSLVDIINNLSLDG